MNVRSLYNVTMDRGMRENNLRSRTRDISQFYYQKGRMPSFSEIGKIVGLRSKNAVSKLIGNLEKLEVLTRDERGRLIPGSIAYPVNTWHRGGRIPESC